MATRRIGLFIAGSPASSASSSVRGARGATAAGRRPASRDANQQGEQYPVRDQRRTAVGQERGGDAGQRDQPHHAADDHEDLDGEADREPGREQLAERVADRQTTRAGRATTITT